MKQIPSIFLAQLLLNGFAYVMEKTLKRDFYRLGRLRGIFLCNHSKQNLILDEILQNYTREIPKISPNIMQDISQNMNPVRLSLSLSFQFHRVSPAHWNPAHLKSS